MEGSPVASRTDPSISTANTDVHAKSHVVDLRTLDRIPGLVERSRRGDRDAFSELYRLYHAPLFRMARFHLVDGAEDAVADTFLRAWSGLARYRDTGAPFVAWLYGIARHVVLDELARKRRVEPWADPPDEARDVAMDDRLTLAAAMNRLPEDQRHVLELKFLIGLTNDEVASAIGKTPGAVNAMQWRALRTLRDTLGNR
jgi:RNA polymerase sigma-70 factor (ECF subfamily)